MRVCPDCWEPKHPALTPRTAFDAQEIYQPRPSINEREDIRIVMRHGVTGTFAFLSGSEQEIPTQNPNIIGFEVTTSVGTVSGAAQITETGLQTTSALGTIETGTTETGFSSTTAVGTVSVAVDDGGWGVETWGEDEWGI